MDKYPENATFYYWYPFRLVNFPTLHSAINVLVSVSKMMSNFKNQFVFTSHVLRCLAKNGVSAFPRSFFFNVCSVVYLTC